MADGKRKYCSNKKERKVTFKLSENDYFKLMEDAKEAGVDKSKYLRALVQNGGKVDFTFPKDRTTLIRQITGIATNIIADNKDSINSCFKLKNLLIVF